MQRRILQPLIMLITGAFLFTGCQHTPGGMRGAMEPGQSPHSRIMSHDRLDHLIQRLDPKVNRAEKGLWRFKVEDIFVMVSTYPEANRLRILVPIAESRELDQAYLYRLMQANFDTALDARYSIARNILWSVYIHPLETLSDRDFLTGIGQVINLGTTFRKSYTAGELYFAEGEKQGMEEQERINRIIKKGTT